MKKIEEINQLRLQYICTWKYHTECPCVATFISNKLKCHIFLFLFFLLQNWRTRGGTALPTGEGWHQWEGGGDGERR
jgi:hypothetical protein